MTLLELDHRMGIVLVEMERSCIWVIERIGVVRFVLRSSFIIDILLMVSQHVWGLIFEHLIWRSPINPMTASVNKRTLSLILRCIHDIAFYSPSVNIDRLII